MGLRWGGLAAELRAAVGIPEPGRLGDRRGLLADGDEDEVDGGDSDGDPAVLQVVELDDEEAEAGGDASPERS